MSSFDPLSFIPGVNLDDSRFSADELAGAETLLADAIGSRYPSLDLTPGTTLYDLVVRPQALLYLLNRAQNVAALATLSLKGVQENPALASDAVVDAIVSNFRLTRRPGSPVSGRVRVNVSRQTGYTVPVTMAFTSPQGAVFHPDADYTVVDAPAGPSQLRLYPADAAGDQFYFLAPVTAAANGLSFLLPTQTELTPSPVFPNLVSCFSFGDFAGGADDESTAELIKRLPEGLSAKNRLSRAALRGELRTAFPSLLTLSVQGYGDPAMQRGADNVFGIKTPGHADVWVRTARELELRDVAVVAHRITLNADGSALFQAYLPATISRGHYFVAAVLPDDPDPPLGSYPIVSQVGVGPLLAYSDTQSATVNFTLTPADGFDLSLDTAAVRVRLAGLPLIPDIQSFLDDPDTRAANVDFLVRAVIPCFVGISPLTVYADDSVTQDELRRVIFTHVTGLLPGEPLTVDGLLGAVRGIAGVSRVNLPLRLAGRVFCPDGTVVELSSENALVIPSLSAKQLVPETAGFFVALEDIPLNVIYS